MHVGEDGPQHLGDLKADWIVEEFRSRLDEPPPCRSDPNARRCSQPRTWYYGEPKVVHWQENLEEANFEQRIDLALVVASGLPGLSREPSYDSSSALEVN